MSLQSIQQQITQKPGKSTMLGILTVVLIVLSVKAALSMSPQPASALTPIPRTGGVTESPRATIDIDLDKRARESQTLWAILREKRGLESDVAYRFDPSYYNMDPAKAREHQSASDRLALVPEKSDPHSTDQQGEHIREAHVRELARLFTLQTTILGPDPKAVINIAGRAQLVHVGDVIEGFNIVAIDSRVVQIEREGVTLGLKMGNENRQ